MRPRSRAEIFDHLPSKARRAAATGSSISAVSPSAAFARGGADGRVAVGLVAFGDFGEGGAGRGVGRREGLARLGVNPLAVDEELVLAGGFGWRLCWWHKGFFPSWWKARGGL